MSSSALLTKTLESGIFDETDARSLRLDDEFAARIDVIQSEIADLSEPALLDRLEPFVDDDEEREQFTTVPRDAVATYLAVAERDETLSHGERLRLLTAIDQARRGPPPASGSPEPFLPVHGDRLELLFRLCSPAIVYVWLDDCDPCETMKAEFERLFPSAPDDITLLSVYGPDWSQHLQEEYDVTGGPTTLFVKNGSVHTRLYGAQYPTALENEMEHLKEDD